MKLLVFNILFSAVTVLSRADSVATKIDENVQFYLTTRKNPHEAIKLDEDNLNEINRSIPVKVIVHGWNANSELHWIKAIRDEYLKQNDYNVIQINWSELASGSYFVVVNNFNLVGNIIGRFIITLHQNYELPLNSVHLIGHSLGAHVCGIAGKAVLNLTKSRISRISALDAASPLFESQTYLTNKLLNKVEVDPAFQEYLPLRIKRGLERIDADIVDVIHTSICTVGYKRKLGTADFYPNGGLQQPASHTALFPNTTENCISYNHIASCLYFIESINDKRFIGTKCDSWKNYKSGSCSNNFKVTMGDGYTYSPEATGKFFLRTDSKS